MSDLYPVVTEDPATTTTDPVYRSVQTVRFPNGRTGTFASAEPYPAGTLMGFSEFTLGKHPKKSVGGQLVDFRVPNNFGTNDPYIPPAG